jgi:hypothetical protein
MSTKAPPPPPSHRGVRDAHMWENVAIYYYWLATTSSRSPKLWALVPTC